MRISYSALNTFKQCPKKYHYQEIEKRKAPKSKEALFGTAVHETLRYMFSRDPLFPTLEEVFARFRALLAESKMKEEHKERYGQAGEKMLKSFYLKNPPWNFNVIDLESRFEVALDDASTGRHHVLVGKIDRIDKPDEKTYEIIDYKTSSRLPSQGTVDNDLQLSLYQLGLQKRWPHVVPENIKLSLYFLRADEKLSTKREAGALQETEAHILSDLRTIEKKAADSNFPPVPSALCNWCGYRPICPAWRHLYEKEKAPLAGNISTEDLVREFILLKKEIAEREMRLKELSGRINEYLNANGLERLFGDSMIIARKIQERTSIDMERLREALEVVGVWDHVLSPDEKLLKKLLPTLPAELQEKIKEAIILKKFSVLSLAKKPNVEDDGVVE